MDVVELINSSYYSYRQLFLAPKEAARKQLRHADLGSGAKAAAIFLALSWLAAIVFFGIGDILKSLISMALGGASSQLVSSLAFIILAPPLSVLAFIPVYFSWLLSLIVFAALVWGIARLFGGRAPYGKQFAAIAMATSAVLFASAVLAGALFVIADMVAPFSASAASLLLLLFSIPVVLLAIYGIWVSIVYTSEANEFELWKGVAAVLVPCLIAALAIAVLVAIAFALFSVLMPSPVALFPL